jgi:hypothetical protein
MDDFAEVNRLEKQVGSESERQAIGGGPAGKPPPGFGEIARRMTSRTTDLIAIGIVVVASLSLGRQVLVWWHAAPPSHRAAGMAAGPRPVWDDPSQPLSLEFGDVALAMTRQVIFGERDATIATLVQRCETAAKRAVQPWRERDAAEDRLLARADGLTPVAQEAGVWQVYVFDERFPMTAAFRQFAAGTDDAASERPRLVCWAMAMPAGKETWNMYVFQGAANGRSAPADRADVPLPPGTHRNLSLRDEQGSAIIGFSGNDSAGQWIKFYDDWFTDRGWSSGEGWLTSTSAWSARFDEPGGSAGRRVEIQFARDGYGELSGLLQVVTSHD